MAVENKKIRCEVKTDLSTGRLDEWKHVTYALPTLHAAIARLYADGHLGVRKCRILRIKQGFLPLVNKGKAHVVHHPIDEDRTWLKVPPDCADEARAIIADLPADN